MSGLCPLAFVVVFVFLFSKSCWLELFDSGRNIDYNLDWLQLSMVSTPSSLYYNNSLPLSRLASTQYGGYQPNGYPFQPQQQQQQQQQQPQQHQDQLQQHQLQDFMSSDPQLYSPPAPHPVILTRAVDVNPGQENTVHIRSRLKGFNHLDAILVGEVNMPSKHACLFITFFLNSKVFGS